MWSADAVTALRAGEVAGAVMRAVELGPEYRAISLGHHADDHVALAVGHALGGRDIVSVADFDRQPLLVIDRAPSERMHDRTQAFFARAAVAPRWRYHGSPVIAS